MNILVPDSWLREYVNTRATPEQIAEKLSLCSLSVEKIHQVEGEPVYEAEITPNRADCLSIKGVAREVSAVLPRFGQAANFVDNSVDISIDSGLPNLDLQVKIQDPSLCPRFTAALVSGVNIKPSPTLIQKRLRQVGARPLNNIIDITNYLMFDLGQPMHAFDYDKIGGHQIRLREAKEGGVIITLDGQSRPLPEGAIVIEDGNNRLIDLCGIMGGLNSSVDQHTERVLFFVQVYDPGRIRRTTMALGHRTEAAARFEKGIDWSGILSGLHQAIRLASEMAGGQLASQIVDLKQEEPPLITVPLDYTVIDRIIGKALAREEIDDILTSLGFSLEDGRVIVPSWRRGDIQIAEDLAEEVARLYGYSNIEGVLPVGEAVPAKIDKGFYWEDVTKDTLKARQYFEVYLPSATSGELLSQSGLDPEKSLKIQNPLLVDNEFLRPSLVPQLLQAVSENLSYGLPLKFFEEAAVYLDRGQGNLPGESIRLGLVVGEDFSNDPQSVFNQVKADVSNLLLDLGLIEFNWSLIKKNISPFFDKQKVGELRVGDTVIGHLGFLDPSVLDNFKLTCWLIAGEFSLSLLTSLANREYCYTPPLKYPATLEDLSVFVPEEFPVGGLLDTVKKVVLEGIVISAEIKEIYRFPAQAKKSVMLGLSYSSPDRTINSLEAEDIRRRIIAALEKTKHLEIRSA